MEYFYKWAMACLNDVQRMSSLSDLENNTLCVILTFKNILKAYPILIRVK